jgi:D-arabinose 1-dehydrogenase-like Zn-dependent alcohol dehydrogenase
MCLARLEPLCENAGGNVGKDCDGGYAEFVKLPAHVFIKLPEGLDYRAHPAEIGVVTDALATPYKVLKRARVKPGETVAVFGAGGGLGIHQLMMAKWARARVIAVDTNASKFEACRAAGADEIVDASGGKVVEALLDLTRGRGVDVAIDYVSTTATLEAGAQALAVRGRLVTLGGAGKPFQVSSMNLLLKEQDVLGSRYVTRTEILEALDLVARGEVRPLVTEIRPLAEAEALHERVERGVVTGRAALRIG